MPRQIAIEFVFSSDKQSEFSRALDAGGQGNQCFVGPTVGGFNRAIPDGAQDNVCDMAGP
jgi:hypothetical protein